MKLFKGRTMATEQSVADLAAASSAGIAGVTWMAQLNELLQMGATGVAIVAGIYAILWHRARLLELKRTLNKTKMYKGTKHEVSSKKKKATP